MNSALYARPSRPLPAHPAPITAREWALRRADPPPSVRTELEVFVETTSGTALAALGALGPAARARLAVVTSNPCPEYALDLWELEPGGLVWGPSANLEAVQSAVQTGHGPRLEPQPPVSKLLPSERAILRFLPGGLGDKHIARRLGLSHRTVRNRLVGIFEKLHLENRTQVALYYSGQWHWLEAYRGLAPATLPTAGLLPAPPSPGCAAD